MSVQIEAYKSLIDSFLRREMSAESFQEQYFEMMKADSTIYKGDTGLVLDELFADADSFTRDPELLAEEPEFYLDEHRLRQKAALAATRLSGVISS